MSDKKQQKWTTVSGRDKGWLPMEIATLELLIDATPYVAKERQNLVALEMREGRSLTQAYLGLKPHTPNDAINRSWIVVERGADWEQVLVLAITPPRGFAFRAKSGLHFDGVAIMDYEQAAGIVSQAMLNRPVDANHVHLYNVHTGEEIHFIRA